MLMSFFREGGEHTCVHVCVCVCFSHIRLFSTLWASICAPLFAPSGCGEKLKCKYAYAIFCAMNKKVLGLRSGILCFQPTSMKMLQTKTIDASKGNSQALHNSWHSEVIYRVHVKITWLNQVFTEYVNSFCAEYLLQLCICLCAYA